MLAISAGRIIRQLRKDAGLTQKQLAIRTGYTQQCISKYEKDDCNIDFKTFHEICSVLNAKVTVTRKIVA